MFLICFYKYHFLFKTYFCYKSQISFFGSNLRSCKFGISSCPTDTCCQTSIPLYISFYTFIISFYQSLQHLSIFQSIHPFICLLFFHTSGRQFTLSGPSIKLSILHQHPFIHLSIRALKAPFINLILNFIYL